MPPDALARPPLQSGGPPFVHMASPWLPCGGAGRRHGMDSRLVLSATLRLGRLALVSYVVAVGTWTLLGPSPLATREELVARAASAPRGSFSVDRAPLVSVSVDGLSATARTAGTVEDALRSLGLAAVAGDRLS